MGEYVIILRGCDDATLFRAELTAAEAELVRRLAEVSRGVSSSSCQPVLYIDSLDGTDIGKVVSIYEQLRSLRSIGHRSGLGHPPGVAGRPDRRARRLGSGRGLRVEPVGDPISGVAGQDRPH